MYSFVSKQEGKVISVSDTAIRIQYKDETIDTCALGRSFGTDSGKTIPHRMITDRGVGYKFTKGEVLAWNPYFFVRCWIEPKQVNALTGTPAWTVMKENGDTYEDGSALSSSFSKKFTSDVTKLRDLPIASSDHITLNVKEGDHVDYDDILCVIESGGLGSEVKSTHLDGLQHLADATPKAKVSGEKYRLLYCGSVDEMSGSVSSLVKKDNKRRKKRLDEVGDGHPTGEVLKPTFIGGSFLAKDTVLIRIYITHPEEMKAGDKAVFVNQAKTVPGKIFTGVNRTETGVDIEGEFSYAGFLNRILPSPVYIGVGNNLMRKIGLNACKVSRGEKLTKAK